MAVPVVAMLAIEGLKVELVDDVEDEPGEVALREPVAQVWWEQEGLVPQRGRRTIVGFWPVGDTAAGKDVDHFGCATGSFELEASDAWRDGLPRLGRLDRARCREPDRHAAGRGGYLWPLSDIEFDVDAGAVELEDRLAVADAQRAVDACGERLDARDEGGRRHGLRLQPQLLELGAGPVPAADGRPNARVPA